MMHLFNRPCIWINHRKISKYISSCKFYSVVLFSQKSSQANTALFYHIGKLSLLTKQHNKKSKLLPSRRKKSKHFHHIKPFQWTELGLICICMFIPTFMSVHIHASELFNIVMGWILSSPNAYEDLTLSTSEFNHI